MDSSDVCYKVEFGFVEAVGATGAVYYSRVQEKCLLLAATDAFGDMCTPSQKIVPSYVAAYTNYWLKTHEVLVLL